MGRGSFADLVTCKLADLLYVTERGLTTITVAGT